MPNMTSDGYFDIDSFDQPKRAATVQQQPKKRGGLAGFVGSAVHGIVDPVIRTSLNLSQAAGNLGRKASGQKELTSEEFWGGTPFVNELQKYSGATGSGRQIAGDAAQVALSAAAPLGNTVKRAAILGAGSGASSALSNEDSTIEDIIAGGAAGGITGGALKGAEKVVGKISKGGKPGGFLENLQTKGQQLQGRHIGVSAGNKIDGVELTPQDTERMLTTLKNEGITLSDANIAGRDLTRKLDVYGKQIADHFKANNAPLMPDDTKTIANNFLGTIDTTDPRVIKEYQILADDLQKNVKDTKSLWEFRKKLDSRLPDSKQVTGVTLSNQQRAIKDMRRYIADELGDVPGMAQYRGLAEIKPFLGKGMRDINKPNNQAGFMGRILSSGAARKAETASGKALEDVGKSGLATKFAGSPASNFASGIFRQGMAGNAGAAMVPGAEQPAVDEPMINESTMPQVSDSTDPLAPSSDDTLGFGGGSKGTDPFDPENIQSSVQRIIQQGGSQEDVSKFLANAKILNDIKAASAKSGTDNVKKTETQRARDDAADLTDQAIAMLSEGGVHTGLVGGNLEKAKAVFGKADQKTLDFNTVASNLRATIAKARAGTAMSDGEKKLLDQYTPRVGDSGQQLETKLRLLKQTFDEAKAREYGQQYVPDTVNDLSLATQ